MNFKCIGVDVFVFCKRLPVEEFPKLAQQTFKNFKLKAVSNRGTRVWPGDRPSFHLTDIYRCRFVSEPTGNLSQEEIVEFLSDLNKLGLVWVHLEKLHSENNQNLFSEMH